MRAEGVIWPPSIISAGGGQTQPENTPDLPPIFAQVKSFGQKRCTLHLRGLRFTWRILARFSAGGHFRNPKGRKACAWGQVVAASTGARPRAFVPNVEVFRTQISK
jgi:hypothetical protein